MKFKTPEDAVVYLRRRGYVVSEGVIHEFDCIQTDDEPEAIKLLCESFNYTYVTGKYIAKRKDLAQYRSRIAMLEQKEKIYVSGLLNIKQIFTGAGAIAEGTLKKAREIDE